MASKTARISDKRLLDLIDELCWSPAGFGFCPNCVILTVGLQHNARPTCEHKRGYHVRDALKRAILGSERGKRAMRLLRERRAAR